MWWSKKSFILKKAVELSLGMARDGGSSHRRSGSNSSVTRRNKDDRAGPSSRRSRDKKSSKPSHTVNIADKNKTNNKSSSLSSQSHIKITPLKVVLARVQRLRAKPINVEGAFNVNKWEIQHMEQMGYILSNILGQDKTCVKFRAHYLVAKEGSLLRQKHHLWCKVIDGTNCDSLRNLKSQEMKILSKLRHPHLAVLHGMINLNQKIFLFTTGGMYGTVMDFLASYGPLLENHGRIWFRQIVNGLDYLHRNDIAHCDLNCETVMLSNKYNILIADFSSAVSVLEDGKKVLNNFVNKSLYSAPEVLLGDEYNPKIADMWSLGVILYAFYMGHTPFQYYGNQDEDLAKLVLNQIQRVWLKKPGVARKLSTHAWQVIYALLEPDFMKRARMRDLKNSELYIMRECVCGQGSYKAMSQEILSSLPDVYSSTKSPPKWAVEPKNDSKTKVVCPIIRQFFTPRKELLLKIEDAEPQPPPVPLALPDVINIEDHI